MTNKKSRFFFCFSYAFSTTSQFRIYSNANNLKIPQNGDIVSTDDDENMHSCNAS